MNKTRSIMLLAVVGLVAACGGAQPPAQAKPQVLVGNIAVPSTTYNFATTFSSELPCPSALRWSIAEQAIGWNPSVDGSVTQAGDWTSPSCGSSWLGQRLHVQATCNESGKTASAEVITSPETVTAVQISYAIVTDPGMPSCLAPDPTMPTVEAGGMIQFYATVRTTCGEITTPALPATFPPTCAE